MQAKKFIMLYTKKSNHSATRSSVFCFEVSHFGILLEQCGQNHFLHDKI